jgi:hypothetical protein
MSYDEIMKEGSIKSTLKSGTLKKGTLIIVTSNGGEEPPPGDYLPSLDFSDSRNTVLWFFRS